SQGDEGKPVHVTADLVIGADGAHSKVRSQLQRKVINGDYVMPPNYLHIWPRKTFMLIALPNLDRSFTCTLFMPWSVFQSIKTDHDLVGLFRAYFPDALALIGEEKLKREYFANPKCSLGYVKCKPYHYKDRVVILGDAAHCMVPFYGQGMNCGFEDVAVLDRILRSIAGYQSQFTSHLSDDQIESALAHYSATRPKNAAAIVDLALHNYIEMRSNVISLSYKFWNYVERILQRFMPHYVIPLYSMVSFSHRPYSEVIDRWKRQTAILHNTIKLFALAIVVGALSLSLTYFGPRVGLRLPHLGELARLFYYHQ
ncbi:kynurenine 3-monooxygenase, mitochondrial precursor, partial [Spiromyces aspiralis]